jgi:prepilin-type N-terminal cleavage/methylation domain-containing protein
MKKSAGFTLVEFIIVLVMVGILLTIAIFVYKSRTVENEGSKVPACEDVQYQENSIEKEDDLCKVNAQSNEGSNLFDITVNDEASQGVETSI